MKNKTKGFSLIELMIVLAVIAAMTVVAFLVYPKVRNARQAHEMATNISTVSASIKSLYVKGNYNTLNTQVAIDANFFPKNIIRGNRIISSFGHDIFVKKYHVGTSGNAKYFQIIYNQVPERICNKVIPLLVKKYNIVIIGGDDVKNNISTDKVTFHPKYVATRCNNDLNNNGGVIVTVVGQ